MLSTGLSFSWNYQLFPQSLSQNWQRLGQNPSFYKWNLCDGFPTCITFLWHAFNFTVYPSCAKPHFHSELSFQPCSILSNASIAARSTMHQSLHMEADVSHPPFNRTRPNWGVLWNISVKKDETWNPRKKKNLDREIQELIQERTFCLSVIINRNLSWNLFTCFTEGEIQHRCVHVEVLSKVWKSKRGKKMKGLQQSFL